MMKVGQAGLYRGFPPSLLLLPPRQLSPDHTGPGPGLVQLEDRGSDKRDECQLRCVITASRPHKLQLEALVVVVDVLAVVVPL